MHLGSNISAGKTYSVLSAIFGIASIVIIAISYWINSFNLISPALKISVLAIVFGVLAKAEKKEISNTKDTNENTEIIQKDAHLSKLGLSLGVMAIIAGTVIIVALTTALAAGLYLFYGISKMDN